MSYFNYQAIDQKGNRKEGTIVAKSKEQAASKIKEKGLYATRIFQIGKEERSKHMRPQKKKTLLSLLPARVKTRDVVAFIRDLSILIDSGIPLVKSLQIISGQDVSPRMQDIVYHLSTLVESGQSLTDSLKSYPKIFPELYINMIRAGELGGGKLLTDVLIRLSDLCESTERLNARIRSALAYPIFVLVFSLAVVIGLVTFVLPKFFIIYDDLNLELPVITQMLFDVSYFLKEQYLVVGISGIALIISLRFLLKVQKVRLLWDKIKLKLPVFGRMSQKVAISRFSRNLGALLNSGVPILQAFDIVKNATGNLNFEIAIEKVRDNVQMGESIAPSISSHKIFPPLVINMIALGEETGTVGNMLIRVADRYEEDVEISILKLASLIEPFMILILGIIVGFIIIALFFPLISVMQHLGG